jgi:hypothetical protein
MRFSALFQTPLSHPTAAQAEPAPETPPPPVAVAAQDLPDDLDARVRLVGEWQLLES